MSQTAETVRTTRAVPVAAPLPTYDRPPYAAAALAGVAIFALYAFTLAPTTGFWDTSEYIATAHILGIPHPPGNPVFVLLARAWELLLAPTGLSTAVRINLFSAVMSAGTAFFWFLVVHRILAFFTGEEMVRRVGAAAAVLLSATAYTVWNQSNMNEKVYTVSLLTIAFLSWLAFLWRDHIEAKHRSEERHRNDDNAVVLMVFLLSLSVGNHLMAFLAAPALVLFLLLVKPQIFLNWRLYALAVVFGVIGLSAHLFLPLRAGLDPIINEAAPTCPSVVQALQSILTFGRAGCEDLSASLAREQYAKPPISERLAPLSAQLANYFQYFDWQWARSIQGRIGYFAPARLPITLLFVLLGAFGAVEHWRRDRKSFAYIATVFFTLSFGLVYYMNFKYGFGQVQARGMSMDMSEVRERDYFFLVSFSLWGLWVGIGLTALWLRAAAGTAVAAALSRGALLRGAPIMALALVPLVLNWPYASRRGDYAARDWAYNLLQSVEPYGVLFTNGDNDTFPLWYLQEVEGIRQDVTVIVMSYLNTDWYARQLRDLTRPCPTPGAYAEHPTRIVCQRPFEPSARTPFYQANRPPTRSILPLDDGQITQVTTGGGGYIILPQDVIFEARGIQTTLPAGTALLAADQFALSIIKNAWGDRPIYFATTTNAHRELRLDRYVARQGVALKLITPEESQGLLAMPQNSELATVFGSFMDVERTSTLLEKTFIHRNLIEAPRWTDDATRGIPTYYGYARLSLAQAAAMMGNRQAAERHEQIGKKWFELADR